MKILIKDAQIIPMTKGYGAEDNYYMQGSIAVYNGKISGIGDISEDGDLTR